MRAVDGKRVFKIVIGAPGRAGRSAHLLRTERALPIPALSSEGSSRVARTGDQPGGPGSPRHRRESGSACRPLGSVEPIPRPLPYLRRQALSFRAAELPRAFARRYRQRDREFRSARLQRTGPRRLPQYRADLVGWNDPGGHAVQRERGSACVAEGGSAARWLSGAGMGTRRRCAGRHRIAEIPSGYWHRASPASWLAGLLTGAVSAVLSQVTTASTSSRRQRVGALGTRPCLRLGQAGSPAQTEVPGDVRRAGCWR